MEGVIINVHKDDKISLSFITQDDKCIKIWNKAVGCIDKKKTKCEKLFKQCLKPLK